MTILLDLDGVLIITPSWKMPILLADNFPDFNPEAVRCLNILLEKTQAQIILTSSHKINHTIAEWAEIFQQRKVIAPPIAKLNNKPLHTYPSRAAELLDWLNNSKNANFFPFLIIDDDPSLRDLPELFKSFWVATQPLMGFNEEALTSALAKLM
jgi:hypothetical protein